jgi:hypothetical protein
MESSISANSTDVKPLLDVGLWKLHTAIRKSHQTHVTLWLLRYDVLKQKERQKKTRRKYLNHIESCLRMQLRRALNIVRPRHILSKF